MVPDPAVEPNGAGLVQGQDRSSPGMSGSTRFTGSWSGSDLGAGSDPELPNEA